MEILGLLMGQIVTMFLYMAVGYWLFRIGKISQKGSGELAALLVWLVIPEKKQGISPAVFLNPLAGATLAGLILFFTGWGSRLPAALMGTLSGLSALNAPLAMMVLGVYVAQADFKTLWTDPALYKVSAVRLLLIPLLTAGLLKLFSMEYAMAGALLIAASAPVGANVAVYAQIHGKDYIYASKTVVVSTLLSVVSLPLVIGLGLAVL